MYRLYLQLNDTIWYHLVFVLISPPKWWIKSTFFIESICWISLTIFKKEAPFFVPPFYQLISKTPTQSRGNISYLVSWVDCRTKCNKTTIDIWPWVRWGLLKPWHDLVTATWWGLLCVNNFSEDSLRAVTPGILYFSVWLLLPQTLVPQECYVPVRASIMSFLLNCISDLMSDDRPSWFQSK